MPCNFRVDPRGAAPTFPSRRERSENWSGAYVTPRQSRGFTFVQGCWSVPVPRRPAGVREDVEVRSSIWIGLDGQRRYLDSSLPQVGITAILAPRSTVPRFEAWWQWWVRGQDNKINQIGLDMRPDDRIRAQLEVLTTTRVRFSLANESSGQRCTPDPVDAPMVFLPRTRQEVQLRVSGATAAWVTERPTRFEDHTYYELADTGVVQFRDCLAKAHDLERTLFGGKLIDMHVVSGPPRRTRTASRARLLDERSMQTAFTG